MFIGDYLPHSRLEVAATDVRKARFPVIDAHNHLGDDFGGGWIHHPLPELLDRLDEAGVHQYVDLDGGWGEDILQDHLDKLKLAGERFLVFGGVNWASWASTTPLRGAVRTVTSRPASS